MKLSISKLFITVSALLFLSLSLNSHAEVTTIADVGVKYNDGITLDKRNNLYISNAGYYGPNGLVGTQVNRISKHAAQQVWMENLSGPLGSAFDKQGNFYVSQYNTGDVYKRDKQGVVTVFSHIQGGGGIAIDRKGNVYVASYQAGAVYKIDRQGVAEVFSDDPRLKGGPVGLTFDRRGNLYTGNFDDGKILKIDCDGNVTEITDMATAGNHVGYLVYAAGNLYTTSLYDNKIFKVSLDGVVTHFAGSGTHGHKDGANELAEFAEPNGITTNKRQDTLYISEYRSPYIRAISIREQPHDD